MCVVVLRPVLCMCVVVLCVGGAGLCPVPHPQAVPQSTTISHITQSSTITDIHTPVCTGLGQRGQGPCLEVMSKTAMY